MTPLFIVHPNRHSVQIGFHCVLKKGSFIWYQLMMMMVKKKIKLPKYVKKYIPQARGKCFPLSFMVKLLWLHTSRGILKPKFFSLHISPLYILYRYAILAISSHIICKQPSSQLFEMPNTITCSILRQSFSSRLFLKRSMLGLP